MYTPDNPPSPASYVAAFYSIRHQFRDHHIDVLRFQFEQPGRSVTSQDIRDYFGYANIGASNLLYGKVGKLFANALPMQTESSGSQRRRFWRAIASGDGTGEHFRWIMRPELADALVEAGVVESESDGLLAIPDIDIHARSYTGVEGRQRIVTHIRRERDRRLVAEKKAAAESLACEVCGFSFADAYGEDYCEVHHLTPLAELADDTETTLDDLAIVCANCHRVIHLHSPPLAIEELRTLFNQRRGGMASR